MYFNRIDKPESDQQSTQESIEHIIQNIQVQEAVDWVIQM